MQNFTHEAGEFVMPKAFIGSVELRMAPASNNCIQAQHWETA